MTRLLSWFERQKYTDSSGAIRPPSVLVSNFEPQNRLEALLIDAGYDPVARPAFEQLFLDSEILIAIRDDGQSEGRLEDPGELGVYTLEADDGATYPVGFTAQDRGYDCFGPETVMAMLTGRQLLEMVLDAGLWINPPSSFGVLWKAEDLRRILAA